MLINEDSYSHKKPEKYSSYKSRVFNDYIEKIRKMLNNIDSLSLNKDDKKKLKEKLIEKINLNFTINDANGR